MVEDISKIISNGFGTYTKNLNICVPFVLDFILSFSLAMIMIVLAFAFIMGSSISDLENAKTPEAIAALFYPLISQHIMEIALLAIIILLVVFFIQAYFLSGAIGMAIQANESGRSSLQMMKDAGKKNFVNMFFAQLLFGLLSLAGIVFIVPGAMRTDFSQILTSENTGNVALLFGGFFLWIIYLVILGLLLAVFSYALVADNLGPLESMGKSVSFFKQNKIDVILLFLTVFFIGIVFVIFDAIIGSIIVNNFLRESINQFISLVIIQPLTTILFVRLYMDKTNKKLFVDDLLAHPNDLVDIGKNNI
ncbi:MAG: hypothetical protein OIN83_07960 [Candidatus Methanoperedens sp.]|nr:hypothetical protein [Candidatus Methanoperedens sp.]